MIIETELKCVIAGSFEKFKPEIDLTIDEFMDLGVTVLAPDKGWLYKPPTKIYRLEDILFRPLPSEVGMSIKQIEDDFLRAISNSDFVYVVNPNGYIGSSVSMEIGFAFAHNVPVYLQRKASENLDPDPIFSSRLSYAKILPPAELVKDVLK